MDLTEGLRIAVPVFPTIVMLMNTLLNILFILFI